MKNRVRDLIGNRHWQSDGEHKEAVLRRLLRTHLAETLAIGRGFVCAEQDTSSQIDVLIVHRDKPTLFRDGDMLLVTPDAVAAIVEVKTCLDGAGLDEALTKLADNAELVRQAGNTSCVAGLFVFEPFEGQAPHHKLLSSARAASQDQQDRVVNWIAAGPHVFVRYWPNGTRVESPVNGPVWHSYELQNLSHAYFVSNVVWDTCPDLDRSMQYAWFPVEGGKERRRKSYIGLNDPAPQDFGSTTQIAGRQPHA